MNSLPPEVRPRLPTDREMRELLQTYNDMIDATNARRARAEGKTPKRGLLQVAAVDGKITDWYQELLKRGRPAQC